MAHNGNPWYWTQEQRDLAAECAWLNDELIKKDADLMALNDHFESKINAQKYGYESKIRELNQKICDLKSSEQQNLSNLGHKCAELTDELLKKDSELEALKTESKDQSARILRESQQKLKWLYKKMASKNTAKTHEIAKLQEKVAEVGRNYDSLMSDSSSQISKLKEENEILRASGKVGDTGQLKTDMDTYRSRLENCLEALQKTSMNAVVAERDRFKADLTKANAVFEEKRAKFYIKLKVQEDKCKEHVMEIDQLKLDLAQSQDQKAELENEKKTYALAYIKLFGKHKKLQKEANRLRNRDNQHWKEEFMSSNDEQGSSKVKHEKDNCGPTPPKMKKENKPK
ncbi:hypothetical protein DdX_14528 [Ditylenchus destructor]|uniref:Uncharacterized protein n=1 Tax=Ditylenchus destructor TaxID=166010 RepID=A0AAD4MWW4_9BILA|nr:hypothetical protein DdX_14528 [Ditylenchus destructor]